MKQTHEADGLYYLDEALLLKNYACYEHLSLWRMHNGTKRTLITLKVMRKHLSRVTSTGALYWLANRMRDRGHISPTEARELYDASSMYVGSARAEVLMDVLAKRARREGKLR